MLFRSKPTSKILKNIGAKIKSKNKVKLDYWLGSMDKIKPADIDKFNKWVTKYKSPYYFSDKLDGVSALLVYSKDNQIKLFTRGNASEGQDISHLIKYIPNIISTYNGNIRGKKNNLAIRGELIMSKKIFADKWAKTMKNSRNTVSGLVNSKIPNPILAQDIRFITYEIVDPVMSYDMQISILKNLKFDVVHVKKSTSLSFDILSEFFEKRRNKSSYDIDGIIINNYQKYKRNTKGNPE